MAFTTIWLWGGQSCESRKKQITNISHCVPFHFNIPAYNEHFLTIIVEQRSPERAGIATSLSPP